MNGPLVTLRFPTENDAELVISANGGCLVYPLTKAQVALLVHQGAEKLLGWQQAAGRD